MVDYRVWAEFQSLPRQRG